MLSIWTNTLFTASASTLLNDEIGPHRLVPAKDLTLSNLVTTAGSDPGLALADVAFGQSDPGSVIEAAHLRWIHLTSAGYTRYDTSEFRAAARARGIVVTNSSTVYCEPCAEHILAFMLANARRLPHAVEVQRTERSWNSAELRKASRLMLKQNVVILGFGAIARRLVGLLSPFSMDITALRLHPKGDEGVRIIVEAYLEQALAHADHVVNVLPENPRTKSFVTAKLLAAMKPGALFYNIGRGATVDQDALLVALRSGHLGGTYLDVTDPEPLPLDHPLWTAPNCFITPHASGGHAGEMDALVRHFIENLHLFTAGSPLKDRIM